MLGQNTLWSIQSRRPPDPAVDTRQRPWPALAWARFSPRFDELTGAIRVRLNGRDLGHANISITLDPYSQVVPGQGEIAARTMEDIVSP